MLTPLFPHALLLSALLCTPLSLSLLLTTEARADVVEEDHTEAPLPVEGFGEDEGGFDDGGFDDGGFDDGGFDDISIDIEPPPPPSPFKLDGFVRSDWAAWTQRAPEDMWAKGRQSLDVSARYQEGGLRLRLDGHVEYDLLYPYDEARQTPQLDLGQRAVYESQYIHGEQMIAYREGSWELSTGRQIVTWGEADALSALDMINPRDQREPGVADVDDLRLAVLMTRLRYAQGPFDVDFVVRHEGHYGLLVPPLADYSPLRAALPQALSTALAGREVRYAHDREGVGADTQSYFLRALYRGQGFDAGLYGASLIDMQGVFGDLNPADFLALLAQPNAPFNLPQEHKRFELVGFSGATSAGSWLFKGEVAGYLNRSMNIGTPSDLAGADALAGGGVSIQQLNIMSWALSAMYTGFTDTTLSFEYQQGAVLGEQVELFIPPSAPLLSARVSRKLLRERLTLNLIALLFEPTTSDLAARGALVRADALYDLTDQLKLTVGYVHYLPGDDFGPFYGLDEHARLFTQLRYNFTLK